MSMVKLVPLSEPWRFWLSVPVPSCNEPKSTVAEVPLSMSMVKLVPFSEPWRFWLSVPGLSRLDKSIVWTFPGEPSIISISLLDGLKDTLEINSLVLLVSPVFVIVPEEITIPEPAEYVINGRIIVSLVRLKIRLFPFRESCCNSFWELLSLS